MIRGPDRSKKWDRGREIEGGGEWIEKESEGRRAHHKS